jgi:hypothetical protein
MARADLVVCTPESLIASIPCLQCLSKTQLEMGLMIAWANAAGYTLPADLQQLIADSACIECGLDSEKKRLQAELLKLWNAVGPDQTHPNQIPEAFACVLCMTPSQVQAATLLAKCKFWGTYSQEQ